MFSNILFPVDFSDRCAQAAPWVAAVAHQFKSKVTLIHAIGEYRGLSTPEAPSAIAWTDWLYQNATGRLQSFGVPFLNDFIVARQVEEGEPARVITDYAAGHEIDLVMMPTHGWGMFRSLLLGSVTSKVLHDCATPVWTTVHAEPRVAGPIIRSIICAVDLSDASRRILKTADAIARETGAALHVVHAIPIPLSFAELGMESFDPEILNAMQISARQHMAELRKEAGADANLITESGFVLSVVGAAVAKYHADLLVIGRGHIQEHLGALRTEISAVIRESACPVLSV